ILILIALIRSILEGLKVFISRVTMQIFANEMRKKIITLSLLNAAQVSSSKAISFFSDEAQRASTAILNLSSLSISITTSILLGAISLYTSPKAFVFGIVALSILYIPVKILGKKLASIGK